MTGFLYIGGMYLGMVTIGRRGASIAVSASQLSVLIPVGLSVVVFGESLRTNQLVGVAIALASLPLLAAKIGGGLNGSLDRGTLLLLAAQLLVQGFAQFSSKVLVASGLGAERDAFFLAVFVSATLATIPIALRHRGEIGRRDLAYGGVVGACNIGGNLSILLALAALPGAIVFPLVKLRRAPHSDGARLAHLQGADKQAERHRDRRDTRRGPPHQPLVAVLSHLPSGLEVGHVHQRARRPEGLV